MSRALLLLLAALLASGGCMESASVEDGEADVELTEAWSLDSEGIFCGASLLSSADAVLCELSLGSSTLKRYDLVGLGDSEVLAAPTDALRLWRVGGDDLVLLSSDFEGAYEQAESDDEWRRLPLSRSPENYVWRGPVAAFTDASILTQYDFLGHTPREVLGTEEGTVEGDVHFLRLGESDIDTVVVLPFHAVKATVGRASATDRHPFAPTNVVAGGGRAIAWAFGGDSLVHLLHLDTGERREMILRGAPPSLDSVRIAAAEDRWMDEKSSNMRDVYTRLLELSDAPGEAPWVEALWVSPQEDVWVGRAAIEGDRERVWEIHSPDDVRRVRLPAHLTVILDVRGGTVMATNEARDVVTALPLNNLIETQEDS